MPRSEATTRTANAARQRPQAPRSRVGTGNGAAKARKAVNGRLGAGAEVQPQRTSRDNGRAVGLSRVAPGIMVRIAGHWGPFWGRVVTVSTRNVEVRDSYAGLRLRGGDSSGIYSLADITAVRESWDTPEANRVRAIGREEEWKP